jgi:hypothetical protein
VLQVTKFQVLFVFLASVKAHIIHLLGDLVEYFKETFVEENVSAVLKLCLDSLEKQRQKLELVLMAGTIKCLDCLLTWFDDSLPAGGTVLINIVCILVCIACLLCLIRFYQFFLNLTWN